MKESPEGASEGATVGAAAGASVPDKVSNVIGVIRAIRIQANTTTRIKTILTYIGIPSKNATYTAPAELTPSSSPYAATARSNTSSPFKSPTLAHE